MNLGEDILRLLYALSGYLAVDTCFLLQFFFFFVNSTPVGFIQQWIFAGFLSQGLQRSRTDEVIYIRGDLVDWVVWYSLGSLSMILSH